MIYISVVLCCINIEEIETPLRVYQEVPGYLEGRIFNLLSLRFV
nr:MAG TPA: hypothetical protein [Caudoviricetes sp.]